MRNLLLAIFVFAASVTSALAGIKVGPVHHVGDMQRLDMWDGRIDTVDDHGTHVFAIFMWDALVLRHLGPFYDDITEPMVLVTGVTAGKGALRLGENGVFSASWYDHDQCIVGVATFTLAGLQIDRREHTLDPVLCAGDVEIGRGTGDDWYLYETERPVDYDPNSQIVRTMRYDANGMDAYRTARMTWDKLDLAQYPRLAAGPDGTMATVWTTADGAFGRLWDAEGNVIAARVKLGDVVSPWQNQRMLMPRALALGQGRFLLAWTAGDELRQWIAREVVVDGEPTTTTTTTTLPDTTEWPEMSQVTKIADRLEWSPDYPYRTRLLTDGGQTWIVAFIGNVRQAYLGAFVAVSNNNGRTWGAPQYLGRGSWVWLLRDESGQWVTGVLDRVWSYWRSADDGRTWTLDGQQSSQMSLRSAPIARPYDDLPLSSSRSALDGAANDPDFDAGHQIATQGDWTDVYELCPSLSQSEGGQTIVAACSVRSFDPAGWGWDGDVIFFRSADGGSTWTQPQPINDYAFGDAAVDDWPLVASNQHGSWMAAWRSTYLSASESLQRDDVIASYSTDDGQTWSRVAALAPQQVRSATRYSLEALVGSHRGPAGTWGAAWTTQSNPWVWGESVNELWVQMTPAAGTCGDGVVSRDEDCDDGNAIDGDGCDSNCTPTGCGNGVVTAGEDCDDGNLSSADACTSSCRLTWCGDGLVRWDTEECDDANTDDNDSCRSSCQPAWCGDGVIWAGREECDDSNQTDGDGCDMDCSITRCGNGIVTAKEECDDGNTSDADGCLDDCTLPVCGDRILSWGEECDDGNAIENDGCSPNCRLPVCGDGVAIAGFEECDDGNTEDGDGCDANCTVTGCGNGRFTPGEFCDDGNTADGDFCSADCSGFSTSCGDADSNGDIAASDALRVLRKAVGLQVECPRLVCDVNGDGEVTAVDGGVVLRKAVGLHVDMRCQDRILVRLASASRVGALQLRIDYRPGSGAFRDQNGEVVCSALIPVLSAFGDTGTQLGMGFIWLDGFKGPVDLAECVFRRFTAPAADDFSVVVEDATDVDFNPLQVEIQLIVE